MSARATPFPGNTPQGITRAIRVRADRTDGQIAQVVSGRNEESPAVADEAPVVPIGELRPYPANSASIFASQTRTSD